MDASADALVPVTYRVTDPNCGGVAVTASRHGHRVIDERHRVTGMSDVDDELDHQGMAIVLIDAFAEDDVTGLAGLDPAGRAAQLQAGRRCTTTSTRSGKARRLAVWTRRSGRNGTPSPACGT